MSRAIPYADHCATERGESFDSQSRPAQAKGCEPGHIPPRCKASRRIAGTLAAGDTVELKYGGFQPAQPIAIVDLDSDVGILITDLKVNQHSLFYRVEGKNTASEDALAVGLGDITDMTDTQVRSGVGRFPPSPLTDQNNPLSIFMSNPTGGDLDFDFALYFGNPAAG